MKLKTLIATIGALGLLSLVAFIARRPEAPAVADARINQPLIENTRVDQASRLRLSDQGKTVTLARQADGMWLVTSYYDLPADFSKLSSFVGSLTEARLQRLVTSNAERIARLEFKDTKIELLDSADKVLWSVTLGKNADTGGGRFVRFGDEPKAYLANFNGWLDTESKNWANPEILNIRADDVAKVEIPLADGGTVVVSRGKKDDPWTAEPTPTGQKLRGDKIASVLGSIGTLRFTETSTLDDPNLAAAKASLRTFKLTTFDQKTISVALGRKPEEKKLKPPSPDSKSGPGALGSVSDLTKKAGDTSAPDSKPLTPEFETIPAGPVFVSVTHSDAPAPINAWMQKRAFQIADFTYTGLPQKPEDLFEAAPPPAESPKAGPAPTERKQWLGARHPGRRSFRKDSACDGRGARSRDLGV